MLVVRYAMTGQNIGHVLTQQMAVYSAHISRRVTWIKNKREGVMSGRSRALKPWLELQRANKRSDGGTGDLSVLTTHET